MNGWMDDLFNLGGLGCLGKRKQNSKKKKRITTKQQQQQKNYFIFINHILNTRPLENPRNIITTTTTTPIPTKTKTITYFSKHYLVARSSLHNVFLFILSECKQNHPSIHPSLAMMILNI